MFGIFYYLFCVCIDYLLVVGFTPFFVQSLSLGNHIVNVIYSIFFLHPSSVDDVVSAQDYVAAITSGMAVGFIVAIKPTAPFDKVHILSFLSWEFRSA